MQRPMKIEMVQRDGVNRLAVRIGSRDMLLDGADVEALIERLSYYRAAMKPAIAERLSPTHRYQVELDPCWHAEPHPAMDGLVMLFRHSGYGWTGFFIPHDRLDALHHECRRYLDTAAAAPAMLPN
jgi:hypothetical protein